MRLYCVYAISRDLSEPMGGGIRGHGTFFRRHEIFRRRPGGRGQNAQRGAGAEGVPRGVHRQEERERERE